MEEVLAISNQPSAMELWQGIGGHFDSLGQIVNEFLDNSVSNFAAHESATRNILVRLTEQTAGGDVVVTIEDTGTGMKDLDSAFTLGSQAAGETPLNEHGFGLKHALASANPANDAWSILTRTVDDLNLGRFKRISAPYDIVDYTGEYCPGTEWPGHYNGTGTIVQFRCSREMYRTLGRGIRGGATAFVTLADILCEDIGFVYAGVISDGIASITLSVEEFEKNPFMRPIGAVEPDWADWLGPGRGSEDYDLGGGKVTISYAFGRINSKPDRIQFDNSTTRKYYMRNMSSSGVEIRINGRVLCSNLFKEIWGIEKHNSYNYLLVVIDLKSQNGKALPKTRTSKNGLREGDAKLEALYAWIRSNMHEPQKDVSLSDHETDLFEELKTRMLQYNPDPNKVIETEMHVFTSTGNAKDRVRIDLYEKTQYGVTIYEGKRDSTTSKDVYQLRMYWDGLVYDGITPTKGVLVAMDHSDSVKGLIQIVNTMKDASGNNYHFETKTWKDCGLDLTSR